MLHKNYQQGQLKQMYGRQVCPDLQIVAATCVISIMGFRSLLAHFSKKERQWIFKRGKNN